MNWYVVATKPNCENKALANLRRHLDCDVGLDTKYSSNLA